VFVTLCVFKVCVRYDLCSLRFVFVAVCVHYGVCSLRFVFVTVCVRSGFLR